MTDDPLVEVDSYLAEYHEAATKSAWRTYNLWMVAFTVAFLAGITMTCLSPWTGPPVQGSLFLLGVFSLLTSARLWFKANRARATWWVLFKWEDDGE